MIPATASAITFPNIMAFGEQLVIKISIEQLLFSLATLTPICTPYAKMIIYNRKIKNFYFRVSKQENIIKPFYTIYKKVSRFTHFPLISHVIDIVIHSQHHYVHRNMYLKIQYENFHLMLHHVENQIYFVP